MSGEFDPYYIWLGIPPAEQPADCYRLLGLRCFESNAEVISNAADQRVRHVRSLQTGSRQFQAQKLLNEIASAAGVLLDPARKQAYDAQLREVAQPVAASRVESPQLPTPAHSSYPPATPIPTAAMWQPTAEPEAEAVPAFVSTSSPIAVIRKPTRKSSPEDPVLFFLKIIGGGVAGLVAGYCILRFGLGHDIFNLSQARAPKIEKKVAAEKSRPEVLPSQPVPQRKFEPTPQFVPREVEAEPVSPVATVVPAPRVAPPVDFFASLPARVSLAPYSPGVDSQLLTIAVMPTDLDWSINSAAADFPVPASFAIKRVANAPAPTWRITYSSDADAAAVTPIAELFASENQIRLRWMTGEDEAISQQLANSLLQVKSKGRSFSIALRKPVSVAAPALSFTSKETTVDVPLPNLPKISSMQLEVEPVGDGKFEDEKSSVGMGKSAVFQFSGLPGAQLDMKAQKSTKQNGILFRAIPEFSEGPRITFELTQEKLEEMQKRWFEAGRKATREINETAANISGQEAQLRRLQGVTGNGAVMAERDRTMLSVQGKLKSLYERLPIHRKRAAEAAFRLEAAPKVASYLSANHEKEKIRFKIYALAGEEVLLLAEAEQ